MPTTEPADPVALWTGHDFHREAEAWVREVLASRGVAPTGGWEQPHARPWSSAIRFETTWRPVWFKVNGAGTRQEPALLRMLAEAAPDLVPDVLAVDPGRGWSLCGDAGPTLRQTLPPESFWPAWEALVVRYGDTQLRLSGARDAVLGAGVREASPATLPDQARGLLDELAGLPVDAGGLTAAESDRVAAVLPRLDDSCAELVSAGVPDSVQHDDLHSANVCWPGGPDAVSAARVIDWGDATWGCALSTLLSVTIGLAGDGGVPEDAPEVRRVRDAYLEPFTAYVDRATVQRCADLALWTGCVGRALSWRAALHGVPRDRRAELGFPVRAWLLELLAS